MYFFCIFICWLGCLVLSPQNPLAFPDEGQRVLKLLEYKEGIALNQIGLWTFTNVSFKLKEALYKHGPLA